jgi:hypothetical protein
MYTLIKDGKTTPEIIYSTPCGRNVLVALVYDLGTNDERIQFAPEITLVPRNMLLNVAKLLECDRE